MSTHSNRRLVHARLARVRRRRVPDRLGLRSRSSRASCSGCPTRTATAPAIPARPTCCAPATRLAAALTLAGDGAKGLLAVFLAQALGPSFGVADWTVPAVALAVFVGHLFPVFHGFAGGKGVATAAGIVFALQLAAGPRARRALARDGASASRSARSRRSPPPRSRRSARSTCSAMRRPRGRWSRSRCCSSGGTEPTSGS